MIREEVERLADQVYEAVKSCEDPQKLIKQLTKQYGLSEAEKAYLEIAGLEALRLLPDLYEERE